jgi:hypothetical protein
MPSGIYEITPTKKESVEFFKQNIYENYHLYRKTLNQQELPEHVDKESAKIIFNELIRTIRRISEVYENPEKRKTNLSKLIKPEEKFPEITLGLLELSLQEEQHNKDTYEKGGEAIHNITITQTGETILQHYKNIEGLISKFCSL